MEDIGDRLIKIAEYMGVSKASDFSKATGFSHQVSSNYLKKNRKPNAEAIVKIKQTFNNIDMNWFVTGNGNMFVSEGNSLKGESVQEIARYLFNNNEELMQNSLFREYIKSNITLLNIEEEQKRLEENRSKIKQEIESKFSKKIKR